MQHVNAACEAQLQTALGAWRTVSIVSAIPRHRRTQRHGTLQTVDRSSAPLTCGVAFWK